MFRRRIQPSFAARIRNLVWPRTGFSRAAKYIGYRVVRLPGSAYAIAGGFAWGGAVSFTPFIGLHFILGGIGAWLTRCNIISSAIGTAIGNPWTFPFIWTLIYHVGIAILGIEVKEAPALDTLALLFQQIWNLAGDWVLIVVGLKSSIEVEGGGEVLWDVVRSILWPMFVGSLPTGVVVWIVLYIPLNRLVAGYQKSRRRRVRRKAEIAGARNGGVPKV